jgi:DNA-directed RNA polymerase sigma subunit (sigma70/sigma32)
MAAARTFEEIGQAMGISKASVQKLYVRAIAKLQRSGEAQQLMSLAAELERERGRRAGEPLKL